MHNIDYETFSNSFRIVTMSHCLLKVKEDIEMSNLKKIFNAFENPISTI